MAKNIFFKGFFEGKKVLVTGHTGFKGTWLTQILIRSGADVIGYSLEPHTEPNMFDALGLKDKIKNYFADIRDYRRFSDVVIKEKPEIIFHLAAQPLVRDSYDDTLYTYSTNVIGTANVLEAIRKTGDKTGAVKAAVIITTDKVYSNKEDGKPFKETDELGGHDPYSTSKACAELVTNSYIQSFFNKAKYGKTHRTLIASARSGNVIGGGDWSKDRIIPDIIRSIMEKDEKLVIRSPEAIRPWQHVLEPLLGYIMLSIKLYGGNADFSGAWNFAPNKANFIVVEELVKKTLGILKKGGYSVKIDEEKHEAGILRLNSAKARLQLKWKPLLGIDKTLLWTFEWYKEYYAGRKTGRITETTDRQISEFLKMARC